MTKVGQHYRATKSLINVEIIDEFYDSQTKKWKWLLRPHVKVDGKRPEDFYYVKDDFEEEIASGRWELSYDPDEPAPDFTPSRSRLGDID